jgi:uncharacterized protein (DUF362 family)
MATKLTRREVLISSLGAAGALAAGRLGRTSAGELAAAAGAADRSQAAPGLPVAIQRCTSYEPQLLRTTIQNAFDLIGGIQKLVSNKTVTIKINVTGGPGTLGGLPGYRTYQIHPNVLAAVCGAIHDAGAKRIIVVESQYSLKTPEEVLGGAGWDVKMIQSAGGNKVTFEDTRNRGKWPSYSQLKVPWDGCLYPAFLLNQAYEKTDVFVSLAKLKDHLSAGVTMGAKNLFGITPISLYGNQAPNENGLDPRLDILHDGKRAVPAGVPGMVNHRLPVNWRQRVPRITADLVGARPVDLCVIDGIETNRAGEGPWCPHAEPLKPNLLLAGRNVVCTDAVATAVMGYDPQAGHGQFPFPGDNHLLLLAQAGVGTIDPKRIEVRGLPVEKALFPFNPKRVPLDLPAAYNSHHNPFAAYA